MFGDTVNRRAVFVIGMEMHERHIQCGVLSGDAIKILNKNVTYLINRATGEREATLNTVVGWFDMVEVRP